MHRFPLIIEKADGTCSAYPQDRTVGVKLPVDRRGGVRSIKGDGFPVPGMSLPDHVALIQDLEEDPG
ncbi:MAG: hypothetical protein ACP5C4_02610 [Methanomicrobiales archaeon]